jgi:ankyrin repeat protein
MNNKTLFDPEITFEEAEELIKHGADVNFQNKYGETSLFYIEDIKILKLFIQHGADVNAKDTEGFTYLFYNGTPKKFRFLIKNGADINARDQNRCTPLHFHHDYHVTKILIYHGADVNAKDIDGHTPLHSASDTNIATLLINNGADINAMDHNTFSPLYYHILYSNKDIVLFLLEKNAKLNIPSCSGLALDILYQSVFSEKNQIAQSFINHGAIAGKIKTYDFYRDLFTKAQQDAFDMFKSICADDNDFYQMCLAYNEGMKNNVAMDIKEMNIL